MLTLQNFETELSETLVKRGEQYYKSGAVSSIEEVEKNTWEAHINGTEAYEIEVKLGAKGKVTSYFCDCPSDDAVCKHVIAALFAIQNEVAKPGDKKTGIKKNSFDDLLTKISVEEYRDFIKKHSAKDRGFKTSFQLWFAEKDESVDAHKKYADLVKRLIVKYTDRGFIDYRGTSGLAKEAGALLQTGKGYVAKRNFNEAFALASAVLTEMMQAVTACDDSNGNVSGTAMEAIQLIEIIAVADEVPIALKEKVYAFLQNCATDKVYFDYGNFGYAIFNIYSALGAYLGKRHEIINVIDGWINNSKGQNENYRMRFFLAEKIELLRQTGKIGEAEKLIGQNMDVPEIRQGEVEKAITKKDYGRAKKLVAEGITAATKAGHPGTAGSWEKQLLRIAEIEKDANVIRYYAKQFAFDRQFNIEYYNKWKSTFTQGEWPAVIEEYIAQKIKELDKQEADKVKSKWYLANCTHLDALSPIYIAEQYLDRLLKLVQNNGDINTVLTYHKFLYKAYPGELLAMYLPGFEKAGDAATDRGAYATLGRNMLGVIMDIPAGSEQIKALAIKLKRRYPRRPAMIDELDKVAATPTLYKVTDEDRKAAQVKIDF